ncbi:MAG: cyclic nucleotide-binding domain-containing protein [Alphaproteobacteria bacterium]|nr:cyclic nucleotide-binding domain-containing protein [Alphaproteobacteria bacterium]MBF0250139.1 cyclic nucleotide-binding domain-containing protein [Alphaproteobacteria bacterium]
MAHDIVIERKVVAAGEYVFKQGSMGRTAYIVQTGSVDILRRDEEGEDRLLANVGPGSIFGEMALIDESPRMASARAGAGEGATVIVVTEQMFLHKLETCDPFIRKLMHIMAETIRDMSKKQQKGTP